MKKEVERFERFEKLNPIYREQIPEEVRMYVWRRDNGDASNVIVIRTLNLTILSPYRRVEAILKEIFNYSVPSATKRNLMSYKLND